MSKDPVYRIAAVGCSVLLVLAALWCGIVLGFIALVREAFS